MTLYRFAEIPSISREYITVEVEARRHGRRLDLNGTGVQFAFVPAGEEPGVGDWVAGDWESVQGVYLARCMVGPGGANPGAGDWVAWIRVVSNPEQPARVLGILRVT